MDFKIGYCVCCGKQAMINDHRGMPVRGMVGTRLVWLVLKDKDGVVKTRIGTMPVCASCNVACINTDELLQALIVSSFSGLNGNEHELKLYPNMDLEIAKTYGE